MPRAACFSKLLGTFHAQPPMLPFRSFHRHICTAGRPDGAESPGGRLRYSRARSATPPWEQAPSYLSPCFAPRHPLIGSLLTPIQVRHFSRRPSSEFPRAVAQAANRRSQRRCRRAAVRDRREDRSKPGTPGDGSWGADRDPIPAAAVECRPICCAPCGCSALLRRRYTLSLGGSSLRRCQSARE